MKHSDEVLHYDDEEDNYVGMGLSISNGNEATAEQDTLKLRHVGEYLHKDGDTCNNPLINTRKYEVQYVGGKT